MRTSIYQALRHSLLYRIIHPINVLIAKRRRKRRNSYFKEEAVSLLQLFTKVLNDNNIIAWLDYGTLLGYYREHDFIPHDCDLDCGSYVSNQPAIRRLLLAAGFKLVREFHSLNDGGIEECYMYKHTTIDVFYYREKDSVLLCNGFRPVETVHFFSLRKRIPAMVEEYAMPNSGFESAVYKNCRVWIPKHIEEYLKWNYGDGFMIPDPSFKYRDVATNVTFYDYSDKPGIAIYYKLV